MSLLMRTVLSRASNVTRNGTLVQSYRQLNSIKYNVMVQANRLCRSPVVASVSARLMSATASHDHSKLWVLEKVVSAGLLAVIPASLMCQNSVLDYALALSLVAHIHWGLEAMLVDYIRPSLVGPVLPKVAIGALYLFSIVALAGLFYLNYSDVGLSTAVNMIVKL